MTIEEKAKAYDEALKWMRELYPGLHGATKEDAEHYFPELRESGSEDERIRKKLIETIGYFRSRGIDQQLCEEFLAWLEKQEQKPAWSEELDIDTLREWSMRYAPDIRQAIESTAYHFYNLRPHWKPSDHQMDILKAVKEYVGRGSGYWGEGLGSLIEDLEKLI